MSLSAHAQWLVLLTLCLVAAPVAGKIGVPHVNLATECDFQYISSVSKSGTFSSPNYPNPYPNGVTCKYHFQAEGKERVQITFTDMDLYYPAGDPLDPYDCEDVDVIVVQANMGEKTGDIGEYCGRKRPPMLMSSGDSMDVFFTSRSQSATKGFNATYKFVDNFGVNTGVQDHNSVCGFSYRSTAALNGTFTSPNYPGLYPRDTECHYLFYGHQKNMVVEINFMTFSVEGIPPKCDEDTQSDYVEFSNFNIQVQDRKLTRRCGTQLSKYDRNETSDKNFFRVTFKSNELYDEMGFKATYRFIKKQTDEEVSTDSRQSSKGGAAPSLRPTLAPILLIVIAALGTTGYRTLAC